MESIFGHYTQDNPKFGKRESSDYGFTFVGMIISDKSNGPMSSFGHVRTHLGDGLICEYKKGQNDEGLATRGFVIKIHAMVVEIRVSLKKRQRGCDGFTWGNERVGNGKMTCRIIDPAAFLHEELPVPA